MVVADVLLASCLPAATMSAVQARSRWLCTHSHLATLGVTVAACSMPYILLIWPLFGPVVAGASDLGFSRCGFCFCLLTTLFLIGFGDDADRALNHGLAG